MVGLPDLPLYILHKALCAGIELDYDPKALENTVIQAADHRRAIKAGFHVPGNGPREPREIRYKRTSDGWSENEGSNDAMVSFGNSVMGGYLKVKIQPEVVARGRSPAGHIAALAAQSSRRLGHGLTDLVPALDVRNQ